MKIQSINPNTGDLIQEFECSSREIIDGSVKRARAAQEKWSALSLKERVVYFERYSRSLQKNLTKIVNLMKDETGKRIPDGEAEVYDVIDAISYYQEQVSAIPSNTSLTLNPQAFPDTTCKIEYVPHGVIGFIMPWNFPFYSPTMYIIAALMTGNAVVLKPSEYSTLVGLEIQKQFVDARFPEGLIEVVIGGEETGKLLVKSAVDKIFFVGSVEAARDILVNAGVKPVQIEAGGNSAALVLDDADINLAARAIAWAGTYNAGQDCVGIKRVFVVRKVANEFLSKLNNVVQSLRPGIDYGPYIRNGALEVVKARITDAVKKGAELLCGGKRIKIGDGNGFWLTPSVLRYTNENIELTAKETFGNTIPVMVVKDIETAIEKANNTMFGLSNAIFSTNLKKAQNIAARLESGMVFINDPFIAMPGWDHWTGWKNSGFGTTESKIMQCLKKKIISMNKKGQCRSFWYPYPNP